MIVGTFVCITRFPKPNKTVFISRQIQRPAPNYSSTHQWRASCLLLEIEHTVYPKKYAHGFCFAVLCCGYTLTDFPISIRLTSLALWQSNDCPSASKATLMNMDKYLMWIHYERLHNHNKTKHNKTVYIFLRIYCMYTRWWTHLDKINKWLNTLAWSKLM